MTTDPLAALLHEKWTCRHGHDRVPYPCQTLAAILTHNGVTLDATRPSGDEALRCEADECDGVFPGAPCGAAFWHARHPVSEPAIRVRPIDLAAAEVRWEKMDEAIREGIRQIVCAEAGRSLRRRTMYPDHEAESQDDCVGCITIRRDRAALATLDATPDVEGLRRIADGVRRQGDTALADQIDAALRDSRS